MATSSRNRSKNTKKTVDDDVHLDAIGIRQHEDTYVDAIATKLPESVDIKFFIPDAQLFDPMPRPKRGDWLDEHKERGQTYKKYITFPSCPSRSHNSLYLLPLTFMEDSLPDSVLQPLVHYAAIFFGMPVKCLPERNCKGQVADRLNNGLYQAHAGEILTLIKKVVPTDAFGVAAITLCDLYPKDEWNFVFGLAISGGRCGVYSLARYLSNFGESKYSKIDSSLDSISAVLIRACKTMCHEIGHMFGMQHCIYFSCLMNGSNHLKESDSRPNFLCPVCLRKLHFACKFDIVSRYSDMKTFWTEHQVEKNVDWLDRRLSSVSLV